MTPQWGRNGQVEGRRGEGCGTEGGRSGGKIERKIIIKQEMERKERREVVDKGEGAGGCKRRGAGLSPPPASCPPSRSP